MNKIDYLEKRIIINEKALEFLGDLIATALPIVQPQLKIIGEQWSEELDKLDLESGNNFNDHSQIIEQ